MSVANTTNLINIDNTKYIEFKHILSGCRTILDAHFFAELFLKKYPDMRAIVYSMINGKRYDNVLDFRTMKSLLVYLSEYDGHDEINKNTIDNTQLQTFIRATKNKPYQLIPHPISTPPNPIKTQASKKCPHCDHLCTVDIATTYIICGYHDTHTGYDWKGCGHDWCFKCGKCLCKTWDSNFLFLCLNRHHDNNCCKLHAKEHDKIYPNEYCQCSNKYVQR